MPIVNVEKTENKAPVDLYYEDHGEGQPIVLIHGWPLSGRAWEKQVPALVGAGYRVISYDRRGFGESSKPWEGYNYDRLAEDLHLLIEYLGIMNAILVGFSMGGGEVARYLASYGSSRVSKIVLACAVTPYMHITNDNPSGGIDDPNIQGLQDNVRADRLAFLDYFTKLFFGVNDEVLISEDARQYFKMIASFASPKATLDCIEAFCCTDFREDLKKIAVPTLVLHGDADAIVPFDVSGKRAAEIIDDARITLIEGGPHGFNATHHEAFNKALLDFLES